MWCKQFDGSTIEDFLEDPGLFRDQTQRACVIAGLSSGSGHAVQLWNSARYLEALRRLCKAMNQHEIGEEMPCSGSLLPWQTGRMLLEPGMSISAAGNPPFVQRSADGRAISRQWVSGIARILATIPGEAGEGGPPKQLTRSRGHDIVTTTKGVYACHGGPCAHGCGTPHVGDVRCIQCTRFYMALAMGSSQVGWRVREAVRHDV